MYFYSVSMNIKLIYKNIERHMYNVKILQKRQKESKAHLQSQKKDKNWLKRYHTQIKPKLLQHYDKRIKAFIRQIEQQPQEKPKIMKSNTNAHYPAFKFKLYDTYALRNQKAQSTSVFQQQKSVSILRSSAYTPICEYQFRNRQKQKQIKPKPNMKNILYRKHQKDSHQLSTQRWKEREDNKTNRISMKGTSKKMYEDNHSQIPSFYEDNQSLRYSANENIQNEARQFQKQQQHIQKKKHFKHLASLEQKIDDPAAKKALHGLLVKKGITRARIKTENEDSQVDFFKLVIDRQKF